MAIDTGLITYARVTFVFGMTAIMIATLNFVDLGKSCHVVKFDLSNKQKKPFALARVEQL